MIVLMLCVISIFLFQIGGCPYPSVLSQLNISNATCMNVIIDHVSERSTY